MNYSKATNTWRTKPTFLWGNDNDPDLTPTEDRNEDEDGRKGSPLVNDEDYRVDSRDIKQLRKT